MITSMLRFRGKALKCRQRVWSGLSPFLLISVGEIQTKMRATELPWVNWGDSVARARSAFFFLLFSFSCFSSSSLERREIPNSYPSCRTAHGGLLNMSHSSLFSVIQEQTHPRSPAICHLSPVLSLQAELWWDRAAAASCSSVSREAMQKGDYSLLFTIWELGSIWISQQV